MEEPPTPTHPLTQEEALAVDFLHKTVRRNEEERHIVKLPRKAPVPVLGESRSLALKRGMSNQRLLIKKDTWPEFHAAVEHAGRLVTSPLPSEMWGLYSLGRLIRVTSWIIRLISRCRGFKLHYRSMLSAEELECQLQANRSLSRRALCC